MSNERAAAFNLEGQTLSGGWRVTARHHRTVGSTGTKYSVCYHGERNGQKGFLRRSIYPEQTKRTLPRKLQNLSTMPVE